MNRSYIILNFILSNVIIVLNTNAFEPIYSLPNEHLYFLLSNDEQILISNPWRDMDAYIFDYRGVSNVEDAFTRLQINEPNNYTFTIFNKIFYLLDKQNNTLDIYNINHPRSPIHVQTVDEIHNFPALNENWAIVAYPQTPTYLYKRNQNGTIHFFQEIDSFNVVSGLTGYNSNNFVGVDYENLPSFITISIEGNISAKWIPLGFRPFIGFSDCIPSITSIQPDNHGYTVTTSFLCLDVLSFPSNPVNLDVPTDWDELSGTGGIVFINLPESENPKISMPVIGAPDDFWVTDIYGLAINQDLYFTFHSNHDLKIWKRIDNDLELIMVIHDDNLIDIASVNNWLLMSKRGKIEVYDIRTIQTQIADWEIHKLNPPAFSDW